MELPPGALPPPDAAGVMLRTRVLNEWLGTNYTLDEVSEMDWLVFDMMGAIKQALDPTPVDEDKPKVLRGRK